MIMMTCAAPMFDANNQFIGCVTVDVEISDIKEIATNIKVGKSGYAMLLTSSGVFMGYKNDAYISKATNIVNVSNSSMAEAGKEILSSATGTSEFTDDDGDDAHNIDEISESISEMSSTIERTMGEVSYAINNIAESTQVTAASSADSVKAVSDVADVVAEVVEMSAKEEVIASDLSQAVSGFTLE